MQTRVKKADRKTSEDKAAKSLAALALPPEIESSGWRFSEIHRKAFKAITEDPKAQRAFKSLTAGKNAISPASLLLNLGLESKYFLRGHWKEWDRWQDKWEYLERLVKSLKQIASKVEKHVKVSDRGPIPLPTLAGMETEHEYVSSLGSNGRLKVIAGQLLKSASEIERDCEIRREWLRKMPRKDRRDIIEKERLVRFMCFVKARTGKPHFEKIATLLNVVRGTSGSPNEISADSLRKLSKRLTTPFIKSQYAIQ